MIVMIAMAAYAFTKITLATIKLIKAHKSSSQYIGNADHATKHIICGCICFDIRIATLDARII